ncbi:hypothetical protein [Haloarchaeobius amylolyticus]|uniref:hypothetical protein n=1 Tax=Haloarchaeobius amylolyticus TaxID=1198296 RepID=UPI00226FC868|nr:hypothetical protein [Haloarchaeobius amylolyticus]
MDTGGDDRWRCANCGHIHESHNPPCLRCAGENLVRVGAADEGGGEREAADETEPGGATDATPADDRSDGFEWADTGTAEPEDTGSDSDHWIDDDWGDPGDDRGSTSGGRTATGQQQATAQSVEHLCKACGARYPTEKDSCPNCGGTDLAPIREVREAADAWADEWEDPATTSSSRGLFGTLSTVVAWGFGLVALLSGVGVLLIAFSTLNPGVFLSGILATGSGLFSVPPTRRRLLRRVGLDLSHAQLVGLIVLLWMGGNLTLLATGTVPAGTM